MDGVSCFDEILGRRFEDIIDVLLRVAVDQRKPAALHVDHDAMPFLERVTNVLKRKIDLGNFAGHERFRFFITVSKPAANDFAANHLLESGKVQTGLRTFNKGMIVRVNVD